jgi:hypothetical protein
LGELVVQCVGVNRGETGSRPVLQLFGLAIFVIVLGGCGAELSRSDLGTVVFEVPRVAGADKPYPMPKLGPPNEKGGELLRRPLH